MISSQIKEIDSIKILIGPHMTEKAYNDAMQQYVFKVNTKSNKLDIKNAIEKFFSVKVKSVKTLNVKGKVKTFKQKKGKRNNWKKAYVQLQEGHTLDFVDAVDKG